MITDLLRETPFASVRDLQERLGVSPATIRRDIDKLHEVGKARKVYGGISATDAAASARFTTSYGTAATRSASSGVGRTARKGWSRMRRGPE